MNRLIFFIATTREIRETFDKIDRELFNFQRHLEQLLSLKNQNLEKDSMKQNRCLRKI